MTPISKILEAKMLGAGGSVGGFSGGSGAGGMIGGILSGVGSIVGAGLNYKSQQDNLAWQKKQFGTSLKREDSAIRRRVYDLKKAGLSPVLAAGQGAQSMAPIQTNAPQFDNNKISEGAQVLLNAIQGEKNIHKTQAEIELLQKQTKVASNQAFHNYLKNKQLTKDIKVEGKTHSKPTASIKFVRDIKGIIQNDTKRLDKKYPKKKDKESFIQKMQRRYPKR